MSGYTQDRLLLQSLAYTKGSTTLFSTNYWYKTDATNCPNGASGNNGQIQCITDTVDSGRNATYTYDALYRLTVDYEKIAAVAVQAMKCRQSKCVLAAVRVRRLVHPVP